MSEIEKKSVKSVKRSDSLDILSREDVAGLSSWERLEETLTDLLFKNTSEDTFKDTSKK